MVSLVLLVKVLFTIGVVIGVPLFKGENFLKLSLWRGESNFEIIVSIRTSFCTYCLNASSSFNLSVQLLLLD